MKLFDAHIHLDQYSDTEIERFIRDSQLLHMTAVSMNLSSSIRTLNIKKKYPDKIFAACGFHPEQEAQDIDPLIQFIHEHIDQIDAIGEIGLPYYVKKNPTVVSEKILREMLEIAANWQKPVILHAVREDVAKIFAYLKEYNIKKAHFHWIKTDNSMLEHLANTGYYVSFTPDIWYNDETAQIAAQYPLPLIMAETDGPWQFEGPFSGVQTSPKLVEKVIERLAKIRKMDEVDLANQLLKNSISFFQVDLNKE